MSSYPPRWSCGDWSSAEGWLHIVSDLGVATAYFAIPSVLAYFVIRRRDVPFHSVFILFAAFILCCGFGHFLEAVIFWHPVYRFAGVVKAVTAIVSWVTVFVLIRKLPAALQLPRLAAINDQLKRADMLKSQFLANVSHEIRTPMTAILGFADVLLDGADDDERRDAAVTIKQNGEHLLAIINDILDLSKIEDGKLAIGQVRMSPWAIVEEVASAVRGRAESRGITLTARAEGALPAAIETDPTRLRQVLLNVVSNAVKFTNAGTVELVVRYLVDEQPPQIQFDVIDTGVGIAEHDLPRLFEPFFQVDPTVTRQHGGTGLGLSISKSLVDLLDGSIEVESQVGRGSRFTIRVPAPPRADASSATWPDAPPATTPCTCRMEPASPPPLDCRVLLVEDGPDNQRLINFLLRKAGAEVTIAENGQEAVDRLLGLPGTSEPEDFDVVLMDMQMPIMDGYTATRRLRDAGFTLPIIALTAHAMAGDRQKCLDSGCDEFLAKPIDRGCLIATVAAEVQRHRAQAPAVKI